MPQILRKMDRKGQKIIIIMLRPIRLQTKPYASTFCQIFGDTDKCVREKKDTGTPEFGWIAHFFLTIGMCRRMCNH